MPLALGERKKDWFIKFHFIRASRDKLPFERAEIVFGFQKSVQNHGGSRAPAFGGARQQSPKSRNLKIGGAFWLKSELFLTKIRTATSDCRASRGRNKNFSARAGKKEGGWGEGIFARPRFRRFFFRRRNFSYFALRNAPPRNVALVPPAHTRATIRNSLC